VTSGSGSNNGERPSANSEASYDALGDTYLGRSLKELEKKLEVADRLHNEFDEIRQVLDGQIGAIDALDKDDEPAES
jgi:hypothetical protein